MASLDTQLGFRMHAERTPNPDSIKWVLGSDVAPGGGGASFQQAPDESVSPLAARLFAVEGVVSVFFAANFVTVTKRPEVEWTQLAQPIVDAIKQVLEGGGSALGAAYEPGEVAEGDAVVERILEVLEQDIRPAVAMDGGDVSFVSYQDGIVKLAMQGSCDGCPSASATLGMVIETRLRECVPEVQEVVSV
ncbi:MAG: NifU family protein [Myxococcota bacterium]